MPFFNEITVVVVCYNSKLVIADSIEPLINVAKIIIVDNAGNIFLKNEIEKKFKIYKYILNKKNHGYAKAANQAIKQCDTEYILMFQADGIISNKDIFILLESHKKYKNCFIASPTYYDKESKLSYNSGYLPEKNGKNVILNLEGDLCVETVLGSIILFKKKDIIEIGLYDENFFLYYLDFELCRRIINKKKSIIQIFDAKVQHAHGQIKVKNLLKKIFIKDFNFTFDELYYFFKIKKHYDIFYKLEKKVPNYLIKFLINLMLFQLSKSTYYFSKILAFYKFKKLLNKNKLI